VGARAYPLIENYARSVTASIVEIGGERGEGSTSFFQRFAAKKEVPFHTVDMVNTGYTGERWLREVFPAKQERVSFAYLDNFDWTFETFKSEPWLLQQVADYAKAGIVMNNANSMAAHLEQTQLLEPFAATDCAILFDDTWRLPDGPWTGKGGTAIPWLLSRGWRILESVRPCPETLDGFALVARGTWHKRVVIRKPWQRSWKTGDAHRDFAAVAVGAAHRLRQGQTLVLYGMGQNGQTLMRPLLAAGVPVAYIDDQFEGDIEAPRLRVEDLGPQHAVLITPDSHETILARLKPRPVAALWRPIDLLGES
jgi:hypothetical protein